MGVAVRAGLVLGWIAASSLPTPAFADASFRAQTTVTAVHVTVTQQPASSLITASLFDDAVAYAAGDLDTGGSSEALAASAFPGRLVVQGPALLCSQVFPCPTDPPAYPLLADASYPRRSSDRAAAGGQPIGGGPFVVSPLDAAAQASESANVARTHAGEVTLLAGTTGTVTIGASRALSRITLDRGVLRVHVESHVSDVAIGDLVTVDAVHVVDDIVLRHGERPLDRPRVTVTGVRVAGQAATVDNRGLHVAGQDGPSLTQQLEHDGISLRTIGVHRTDSVNGGRSDGAGLEISVALPVSGVPYVPNPLPPLPPPFDQIPALPGVNANGTYVGHVTLGAVGAAAATGAAADIDLSGVGRIPPTTGSSTPAAGGTSTTPGSGTDLLDGLAAGPAATAPVVTAPASVLRRFADALSKGQLEALYAVLALGTAGLFLGWRATVLLRGGRR